MLLVEAFFGLVFGAALMLAVRHMPFAIFVVPLSVAVGPLVFALRGRRPSKAFLVLYILVASLLYALMAMMSPGWRNNFDAP